jgi:hypothetical protein
MRLGLTVLFVALLLAVIAGQNTLLQSTEAQDDSSTAITACAVQGERCAQPPLDSSPSSLVLEHRVLSEGCHTSDLHVVRYVPEDSASGDPVVAQWWASP